MKKIIKHKFKPKRKISPLLRKASKYVPFHYINDDNLKQLIYLIRKEPPQSIALVVSYLKPEYVQKILSSLPNELQARVAVEMSDVRLVTQDQLIKFDIEMKKKVDFVIGGLDNLLEVLEKVDRATLENILDRLKETNFELYEKVRKFIVTFDDIPAFPNQAMQAIIRELKSEAIARALRGAPIEIINKFFINMSSSAAAMIKEEMEYGRPATQDEINDERKKLLDLIKQMEKDGKIFVREKPKNTILEEGYGEIMRSDASIAEGNYDEYYANAESLYEAGNYEEALRYFEYCSGVKPSDAVIYQYIGGCYYSLGRLEEAVAAYEKALELDPSNEEIKNWIEQQK